MKVTRMFSDCLTSLSLVNDRVCIHPQHGSLKRSKSFSFFVLLCSNSTLWGSLKEPNIVNTNEFEDLFSKATLQPKKKPLSDTYEKKAKAKKVRLFASHLCLDQNSLQSKD